MPTNELTSEKCIADDLPDLGHPPVPDPELFAPPDADAVIDDPPTTHLLIEGFEPDKITVEFLLAIHDAGDEQGLPVESISVRRDWGDQ